MKNFSQYQKQYKTKEFEHCFCQYLKNNMADIRLIPPDHVTYNIVCSRLPRWKCEQSVVETLIYISIDTCQSLFSI